MPTLTPFPTAAQAEDNSCWACAARCVSNWYQSLNKSGVNPFYATDQEFATAWENKTQDSVNGDINIQQSATEALKSLGYVGFMDERAIPTQQEIADTIAMNQPLLSIVGPTFPNPNPDDSYQNGHWVVIIGISKDKNTIKVFDPADGLIHRVVYDTAVYPPLSYWANSSYIDPQ